MDTTTLITSHSDEGEVKTLLQNPLKEISLDECVPL